MCLWGVCCKESVDVGLNIKIFLLNLRIILFCGRCEGSLLGRGLLTFELCSPTLPIILM